MLYQPMADKATMVKPITMQDIARKPEVYRKSCRLITVLSIEIV